MIITRIAPGAGMGNQMFMYAAGLALASRLGTELRLGVWSFNSVTMEGRGYRLQCFPEITEHEASFKDTWRITPSLALMNEILCRKPIKKYHLFRRTLRKFLLCYPKLLHTMYAPNYGSYSPEFENIKDNTCINGYWESERIFVGIKDLVRKKFTFAPECFDPELTERVRSCNSVALHVRRGDKVTAKVHYASHELYIRQAIDKIFALTDNPKFFVFSDDIEWCKENLPKIYDTEYSFIEGQLPPSDMALMTQCKHVIMGPSTFSWWGAWLNDNPNKIIIAPDINLWYPEPPKDRKYLLPDEWIKIR